MLNAPLRKIKQEIGIGSEMFPYAEWSGETQVFPKKMTFEQILEGGESMNHKDILGKRISSSGNSNCKNSEKGVSLV